MTEEIAASETGREPGPPSAAEEDAGRLTGASRLRLVAVLALLVLLTEIVPLQSLMVSAVMPKIGQSFPNSGHNIAWILTIQGVVSGATIAIIGKTADMYGKKVLLLACAVLFVAGSLLCALTSSWPLFLAGRGIEAVSWGMVAVNYGLLRDIMPRKWVPIAVAVIGSGVGGAAIIGPPVVGAMTDHFSWRSVFWFLTIYTAVLAVLVAFLVPESPLRARQRFDVVGAVLFGVGIGVTLIYLSEGSSWGWSDAGSLAYLAAGLVILAAFFAWERRAAAPMLDLSVLRMPAVSIIYAVAFLLASVQAQISILVPYMFQTPKESDLKQQIVEGAAAKSHTPVPVISEMMSFRGDISYGAGYSVLDMAVHITIWTAVFSMVFGMVCGWLCRRIGARIPLIIGVVSTGAACALWINWHSTWQLQVAIGVLFGLGTGFHLASFPNILIDSVSARQTGIVTAMASVFGSVGIAVSSALLSSILAAHPFQTVTTVPGRGTVVSDVPQVFTDPGFSLAYLLLGVVPCVVAVFIAFPLRAGRAPARGGEVVARPA
ncbi:MFS transporter [Actinomadura napierensis]|uniref:Major facilitator superfamily (MFS) profile domain-containing protein n=1 Tax=Actinomadura napierensis TaxID=267854 RepID=A0ABP5JVK2_9ACTN